MSRKELIAFRVRPELIGSVRATLKRWVTMRREGTMTMTDFICRALEHELDHLRRSSRRRTRRVPDSPGHSGTVRENPTPTKPSPTKPSPTNSIDVAEDVKRAELREALAAAGVKPPKIDELAALEDLTAEHVTALRLQADDSTRIINKAGWVIDRIEGNARPSAHAMQARASGRETSAAFASRVAARIG